MRDKRNAIFLNHRHERSNAFAEGELFIKMLEKSGGVCYNYFVILCP